MLNETIDGQEDIASDCMSFFAGTSDLPYIMPTNLSSGGDIPLGFSSVAVTDVVQKAGRDTAHFKYDDSNYFWDREKGALVEYTSTGGSLTMTFTETNIWGGCGPLVSDSHIWIIITVVLVIVGALFVLVLLRRKPTTTLPPLSPAPPLPP